MLDLLRTHIRLLALEFGKGRSIHARRQGRPFLFFLAVAIVLAMPGSGLAQVVIDDFVEGPARISACGNSIFVYSESPTILGGAREARARDGHSCVLGGRAHLDIVIESPGYADFYGATANEETIQYGTAIGTVDEPWSRSPNKGKGVELNLALTTADQFQFDMLLIDHSNPYFWIQILSGKYPGSIFTKFVNPVTVGANLVPLTGFADPWNTPMPDDALADIDGIIIRVGGRTGNTPGSGHRMDRFSIAKPSDSTPPVITPSITGTLGSTGWYVSNVGINWTVTDAESTVSSSTGCDPASVNTDTTGVTFTCTATSSGGTASASVTIRRDVTPPTITATATAGGSPYTSGTWTNKDVTVTWTCSDGTSGVASYSSPLTVNTEGAGQSASGFCADAAGNFSYAAFVGINIDKTPPLITGMPATGACSIWPPNHNMVAVATVSASDSASGVGSFTVTGASNEPDNGLGDGDTAGDISITGVNRKTIALRAERAGNGTGRVYTLNATATDLAGNLTTVTSSCTVPRNQGK